MLIPDSEAFGAGLRKWREYHKRSVEEVEENSQRASKRSFKANQAYKWEKGTQSPTYKRLVEDILPAYGIRDLHQAIAFLVAFCQRTPGLESVKFVKYADLSHQNGAGMSIRYAEEERISPHVVRIDQVTMQGDQEAEIKRYPGYNYLLLVKGRLRCSFWSDHSAGRKRSLRHRVFELSEGDAVSFPTELKHRIEPLTGAATAVIARAPWSE